MRCVVVVAAVVFIGGFASTYGSAARGFTFYGFLVLSLIGVLGIAESLITRIELREGNLKIVGLAGTKRYARSSIESVSWAKGCPVSLRMVDGGAVDLPNTGHSTTKVAGALRAWLNERDSDAAGGEASSLGRPTNR
jgi:hypothetical protein